MLLSGTGTVPLPAPDRLRAVYLHARDKYLPLTLRDTRQKLQMEKVCSDSLRDYYEAELCFSVVCLRYYFEIVDEGGESWFYSNDRFTRNPPTDIERFFDCPQNLREEERFVIPGWAKNKVLYQVFPSRFATTEAVPDKIWYQAPIGRQTDLKGNLPGITEGRLIREDAWDDLALVRITRELKGQKTTVIFHAADGAVQLPELAGKQDLLTGTTFDGTLTGYAAMVMEAE